MKQYSIRFGSLKVQIPLSRESLVTRTIHAKYNYISIAGSFRGTTLFFKVKGSPHCLILLRLGLSEVISKQGYESREI